MDRYLRGLLLLVLAGAIALPAGLIGAQTNAGQAQNPPQKKGAEQKQAEQTDQDYTEEEYNAMEAVRNEQDPAKKAALVMAFLEKYPKSTLKVYVINAYETMLFELSKAGDHQKLMQFSEQWLKLNPNDVKCQAYIFDAAVALGQHQKTVDFGEKVFAVQPSAKLALPIYQAYEKLGNKVKREEWALKLLQFPEYANDIQLRMQLVFDYAEKDLAKSAMYAEQALKALPNAQKPAEMQDGEWAKALTSVKKTCYDIVGKNFFTQNKFSEAIQTLAKANQVVGKNIVAEKYDEGFYYIGMSQWKQGNVEDAWLSLETAAQIKGKLETKAHKYAIDLYKSQRNDTEVGFDKVVKKALAILDAMIKGTA
jgi:tetratricopeptide (TPR) repeat protein